MQKYENDWRNVLYDNIREAGTQTKHFESFM